MSLTEYQIQKKREHKAAKRRHRHSGRGEGPASARAAAYAEAEALQERAEIPEVHVDQAVAKVSVWDVVKSTAVRLFTRRKV